LHVPVKLTAWGAVCHSKIVTARRGAHLTFVEPACSPGAKNKIIIIETTPRGKRIATETPDKGEMPRSRYACQ
jgi:hypothetical protein